MSWLFSQALVAAYLPEKCLDGEQFAPSNGNLTQQAYCAPDKMMDFSRLSRFGMTFKPLTADRGEELLTLFRAAFPAKTLVPQEKEPESKANDQECGNIWRGSLAKFDPDSRSWKTAQCSVFGGLEPFWETWPRWGSMLNGECWEQRMLEKNIKETESGFWPTPQANEDAAGTPKGKMQKMLGNDPRIRGVTPEEWMRGTLNPTWVEWLMGWPLGWTDLKPLETDKFPNAPQPPGKS